MSTAPAEESRTKAARYFAPWETAELPSPPKFGLRNWGGLIGPGLLLVGSNIGGGEWLFGPIITARYGGQLMWLATLSIGFQVFYNLSVMRYTLYTGEPIFVGFFRTAPGPKFWVLFYILLDLGGIWPYLAANAAVPLSAVILGRLPTAGDDAMVRTLSYVIFLCAFLPLIFGGKIYNAVERVLVTKVVLVLGYLSFVCVFMVSWETWVNIFSGFLRFGSLPKEEVDWATLAAFAAIAGAGGLTNMNFSNYTRDKGWGMGSQVGAIPSMVGGKKFRLSHVGKVFPLDAKNLANWRGWLRHILRDQTAIWAFGCVLGMALPSMLSLEFIPGATVEGHAAAAMTAEGMAASHGQIFWYTTLLCGFIVLAPPIVSDIDGISRRWTDVIWTGSRHFQHLEGHKVKYIYYAILAIYGLWGLIALRLTPNPLVLAIVTATLRNIGLGFTALHTLYINRNLLPAELRPPLHMQLGLIGCFLFFLGISVIAFHQQWTRLMAGA
jgi:hypothetical protein